MSDAKQTESEQCKETPEPIVAVTDQPHVSSIAPMPSGSADLAYLAQLDTLHVHQKVEVAELMTNIETKNKYQVLNSAGQQVYYVYEESGLCMRLCCKNHRGFQMHVLDGRNKEVMRIEREFSCCTGCCWCAGSPGCGYKLTVQSPVGTVIGTVNQAQYCIIPAYEIRNANGELTQKISGPCCVCGGACCCQDVPFPVLSADGSQQLGCVSRQYAGIAVELFTKANNFRVVFPRNLDVNSKALIFASTFLIDMMFFEMDK